MKLEDQVCSLELAKQLKELGIRQESVFHWVKTDHLKKDYSVVMIYSENFDPNYITSAFTVAELGALLPNIVQKPNSEPFDCFRLQITKFISIENNKPINNFIVAYICDTHDTDCFLAARKLFTNTYDPNLANAMAKVLISLIDSKLIEVPK